MNAGVTSTAETTAQLRGSILYRAEQGVRAYGGVGTRNLYLIMMTSGGEMRVPLYSSKELFL